MTYIHNACTRATNIKLCLVFLRIGFQSVNVLIKLVDVNSPLNVQVIVHGGTSADPEAPVIQFIQVPEHHC